MVSRLDVLDNHQAFVLLRNAFFIPKLLYVLPSFTSILKAAGAGGLRQGLEGGGLGDY